MPKTGFYRVKVAGTAFTSYPSFFGFICQIVNLKMQKEKK
jgi:hypothetical protein